MFDTMSYNRLDHAQRLALVQSAWSHAERRRRRELAAFLQRRLAWQIALDTASQRDGSPHSGHDCTTRRA